jgi:multiple sugar transport system substrate-binding protein
MKGLPFYYRSLLVLLIVALIAGCNPTPAPNNATATVATTTNTPPSILTTQPTSATVTVTNTVQTIQVKETDLKGTTVQLWHPWSGKTEQTLNELTNQFNTSNPWGINLQSRSLDDPDALAANISNTLKTSHHPDIVLATTAQEHLWDQKTNLVNLESYVHDSHYGYTPEQQADFYPPFWQQEFSGQKQLGLPAQRTAQMLYYNTTWAQELGFKKAPVNTREFQEQACSAAKAQKTNSKRGGPQIGGWIISTHYSTMMAWLGAFDATPQAADGKSYQFNDAQASAAFTYLRNLYDNGCAWQTDNEFPLTEFAQRQGLFASGSVANIPAQIETFRQIGNNDQWTIIPIPGAVSTPTISVYGYSYVIFPSTPVRQLAAWLAIKWLDEPTQQARLAVATSTLPLRAAILKDLKIPASPQWKDAAQGAIYAQPEPALSSWSSVRWAVSDAGTQLFRSYFSVEQVPDLMKLLDQTANDLNSKNQ